MSAKALSSSRPIALSSSGPIVCKISLTQNAQLAIGLTEESSRLPCPLGAVDVSGRGDRDPRSRSFHGPDFAILFAVLTDGLNRSIVCRMDSIRRARAIFGARRPA